MIGIIFEFNSNNVEVRVDGNNCGFRTGEFGGALVPIDSLKIDKAGSIKEHPDLKDDPEWKIKTIKRFKEKISGLNTEGERVKYIINDLKKYGYVAKYMQKAGHRLVKIKNEDKK